MTRKPPKDNANKSPHLPDNLADCHDLIRELFARIAELEKQLSRQKRARFGRKSAKINATLLTGTGKAVHTQTINELDAERERLNIVPDEKQGGGRADAPDNISTRKVEHRIEPQEIPCPCCGNPREIIGFDVFHQIEF